MTISPARRLIVLYATLWVALDLFALLPGNPEYSSYRGFIAGMVIQALIVWPALARLVDRLAIGVPRRAA